MIKLIAGYDKNGLIGKNGILPWDIPEDLEHFKKITLNKIIILGDVTFKGIGKPLPKRKTIVLTTNKKWTYEHKNVEILYDFMDVVRRYKNSKDEVYICGGAKIFELFLPYVNEMIISHIDEEYDGDSWFPKWNKSEFFVEKTIEKKNFTIKIYKRKLWKKEF